MNALAVGNALAKKYIIKHILPNEPYEFMVSNFIRDIARADISLQPRTAAPVDLTGVRALLKLPRTRGVHEVILKKEQFTTVPPHLHDKFFAEWGNNFVNKIIQDYYCKSEIHTQAWFSPISTERRQKLDKEDRDRRRIAIDAHINNAIDFSDSEDDAFSA